MVFVNPVTVKAQPTYIIRVKTYQLYVHSDTYDGGASGEFVFQCSFEGDFSPKYSSSEWSLSTYSSRTYIQTLRAEGCENTDRIYFRLIEKDPGPDDMVIQSRSKLVSQCSIGNNYFKFYDDASTGLWCRFLVVKEYGPL